VKDVMKNATDNNSKGPAQKLIDLQEDIVALLRMTSDPEQRKQLSDLRKKYSAESRRLIAANLNASAQEYQQAAAGLETTALACREAIDRVNSVQTAINALAGALELVAKIAVV
jgi:flagellin-specific chaperone FliS